MKAIRLIILLAVLLTACQSATPEPAVETLAATDTAVPPTSAASATAPNPTATIDATAACKLPALSFNNVALGFPPPAYRMPSTGTVRVAVVFADFDDAPASRSPEEVFAIISPQAETMYRDMSNGRLDLQLEPHFTWLRLSQPSAYYGSGIATFEGHQEFLQEAMDLADADVDFSEADLVLVLANPDARNVAYGPAFGGDPGYGIKAGGVELYNGVTSGYDLLFWGSLWLNHEVGHSMGLNDLYGYSGSDAHRFVGGWSLMGLINGRAPEYFAFERWQLGWLDDDQIVCQESGEQTTELSAIEVPGGTKAVIVPLDGTRALVIESRRALGYDTALEEVGALVYLVDTNIYSGEGTIVVLPEEGAGQYKYGAPLAPGETLEFEGVTITVLEASDQSDTVHISIAP